MKKRTKSYSREFKLEAVRLSHASDRTVAEVASELGISKSSLFRWWHELAGDREQAFPGRGQMKDRDAEINRLRKELRAAQLVQDTFRMAFRNQHPLPGGECLPEHICFSP